MSKMKKQTARKLSRQIKCVKMMSEPLTDEQNAIMQAAMETRLPVLNDFYGRYSGIQSLGHLDARKIRDALKPENPSEQFGCTVRLWTMALFDVIANIKSAWSNLANRLKVLIRDNDDLAESEKDYLRYVVKSPAVWGDILCGRVVQKQSTLYRKLASAVDESRIAHDAVNYKYINNSPWTLLVFPLNYSKYSKQVQYYIEHLKQAKTNT